MSGSLNRFTAAAEFQTRHPFTSANACMRPVEQDDSLQSSFFWMSLNEFTERKKAQRTLGFLTDSGLKLHTCFCDQRIQQHQWCTAIHRKVSEEHRNKTEHKLTKKGLQSEGSVQKQNTEVEYRNIEAAQR